MKLQTIFAIVAMLLLTVLLVEPSFAQVTADATAKTAGSKALGTLTGAITGNLGLLIGLGLAIGGLWTWIVGQNTSVGLLMIAGGIMLTLSPGVFNGAAKMVAPLVKSFGDNVDSVQRNTGTAN